MRTDTFETPVALFAFNRPHITRRVFEVIAKIRPTRLLLIADGPRPNKTGEAEACRQVREVVSRVDWPCDVSRNFAESNLGCQERVISGLNWVFSCVEEAIILEDDCLPDLSFFPFCQKLLEQYRGDSRIAFISGANLVEKHLKTDSSYFFSQFGGIWGWATWRSEWKRYDRDLKDWPALKRGRLLNEILEDRRMVAYWTRIFDDMHQGKGLNTWDIQWQYTCLKNNSLTAVSSVNLIENIGFGADATHTTGEDARLMLPAKSIEFPLRHPLSFIPLRSMDRLLQDLRTAPISRRIAAKARRISNRIAGREL
jgi:hypothetical protein